MTTYEHLDRLVDVDPIGLRDTAWAAIQELRAEVARLHEHEDIRAKAIRDHQSRLIAADAALAERDNALAEVERLRSGKQQIVEQHNRLAKQWIYERDKAEAERDRLRPVVEAARAWRGWHGTKSDIVIDGVWRSVLSAEEKVLAAAVDALGSAAPTEEG